MLRNNDDIPNMKDIYHAEYFLKKDRQNVQKNYDLTLSSSITIFEIEMAKSIFSFKIMFNLIDKIFLNLTYIFL